MKTKYKSLNKWYLPGFLLKYDRAEQIAFLKRNDRARGILMTDLDAVHCLSLVDRFFDADAKEGSTSYRTCAKAFRQFYDHKARDAKTVSELDVVHFVNR